MVPHFGCSSCCGKRVKHFSLFYNNFALRAFRSERRRNEEVKKKVEYEDESLCSFGELANINGRPVVCNLLRHIAPANLSRKS